MVFNALLFDLDGTLIDSLPDITAAANHALGVLGRPPLPPEDVRGHVGQGAAHLLTSLLGAGSPQDPAVQTILPHFLGWYETHATDQTVLYPGVRELLDALTSVNKVVISNKPSRLARAVLESLGVAHHFRAIHGGEDFPRKKPDPLPLLTVLERLGTAPDRAMMIGDSQFDILAGRAAGTATCAVSWGLGLGHVLSALEPDVMIERPAQLLDVLHHWVPRDR